MRVLVTGSTGFVGSELTRRLSSSRELKVRAAFRRQSSDLLEGVERIEIAGLTPDENWRDAVQNVEVVVHSAARVHIMHDHAENPLAVFRHINVEGTLNLARQAAAAGVRRFVFLSSVKVNGEETALGAPFKIDATPQPGDPYAISKWEAELGLRKISASTGMEVSIIRPPLVYGPGVRANFLAMMTWLSKGVPLPFGAVTDNRRSLVALENLVDLIVKCTVHPAAGGHVFFVSDDEDLSTAQLLRRIGAALGRPARLLPVPTPWLMFGAKFMGRGDMARRLLGSLQVDLTHTRKILGWCPPSTVDKALEKTAVHFMGKLRR